MPDSQSPPKSIKSAKRARNLMISSSLAHEMKEFIKCSNDVLTKCIDR